VRLWKEVEPFYKDADRGPYKSVESRGTESVLNALILSSRDAQNGQLSNDARKAFENMWAEQQIAGKQKGAWLWLRFKNEPWEADDSGYFGATLAAVALGIAPGNYWATPEAQTSLRPLREYLNREFAVQIPINRVLLLWAAAKLPGLLEPDRQKAIIGELLEKQRADGGWSLSSLSGDWKRADGTSQETTSDGYATGLMNLFRNVGGSGGIAMINTIIARRAQFHQATLVSHLTPLDAGVSPTLHGLTTNLVAHGASGPDAFLQAQGLLYGIVQKQAAMLAVADTFWLLAIVFLGMIPLVLLLRRSPVHAGAVVME